jgi:hypothetical protein
MFSFCWLVYRFCIRAYSQTVADVTLLPLEEESFFDEKGNAIGISEIVPMNLVSQLEENANSDTSTSWGTLKPIIFDHSQLRSLMERLTNATGFDRIVQIKVVLCRGTMRSPN